MLPKPSKQQLQNFIEELGQIELSGAFNQYGRGAHNATRRQNLLLYFMEMAERSPKVLLLGEAPGYQGMRLTGIPFTSEHQMLAGIEHFDLMGESKGYRKTAEFEKVYKEPTGTIMWSTLSELNFLPLLWGTFPFHPYKPGNPLSNRAPAAKEVGLGIDIFQRLMELFAIEKVIAVGNVAAATLANVGIEAPKVRHPSHGGKLEFETGLRSFLGFKQQSKEFA